MPKLWDSLENFNKRSSLLKGLLLLVMFYIGMIINATYEFFAWVNLPYVNQQDIVILLERSQAYAGLYEEFEKIINRLDKIESDNEMLYGKIITLQSGQHQLILKVERLDERTSNRIRNQN